MWLYSGKSGYSRANRLYSCKFASARAKVVVFKKSGFIREKCFIRAKVVVFGQRMFYSGKRFYSVKSGCIRAKWLCSGKNCCILADWLFSFITNLFGQKSLCFGNSGCFWATVVVLRQMWFYSCKVVVFVKAVVFRQKWWYSGKSGCTRAEVVVLGKSGSIREVVVIFGQSSCTPESGCFWAEEVLSGNVALIGQKWL